MDHLFEEDELDELSSKTGSTESELHQVVMTIIIIFLYGSVESPQNTDDIQSL